jgi:hypothetical protein
LNDQAPNSKPIAPIAKTIEPYSIIQDLKDQKANITFAQLLQVAPSIRAELTHGLRKKKEETSAFNSLPSTRTTALCCAANINGIPITLIIDSGASSSVVSKAFLDDHNIHIERPSTVTMTNINGIKTTPLGAIDNFPITVGTITTPIKVDVTDAKTYSVIAGNDWLMQVKATIDYSTANLTIRNDNTLYQIPCNYLQDRGEPIQTPVPISKPQEEETFDDLFDEQEYLYNDSEPVALQQRTLSDIKWGRLDVDDIKYLPRRTYVHTDEQGIVFDKNRMDWTSIQALHGNLQRKPPKNRHFHWHGPGARCWCENPLHAPTDMCHNCYSYVTDYVNCRLHMTHEEDAHYLGIQQDKPAPLLKVEQDNPANMTASQQ